MVVSDLPTFSILLYDRTNTRCPHPGPGHLGRVRPRASHGNSREHAIEDVTHVLELARRGVSREQAYEWVQRNAMRSFHEASDFKTLLLADADVARVLTPAEIGTAFDLGEQMRHVDDIFDRVFGAAAAAAG